MSPQTPAAMVAAKNLWYAGPAPNAEGAAVSLPAPGAGLSPSVSTSLSSGSRGPCALSSEAVGVPVALVGGCESGS